jgi:hypothetical protein
MMTSMTWDFGDQTMATAASNLSAEHLFPAAGVCEVVASSVTVIGATRPATARR